MREKKKFALIGSSCAGKTTMMHWLISELKMLGVLADGLCQHDRSFTFDKAKLDTHKEAQYWMILNIASKECELLLRDDVDVLVSDRSVVDYFAYFSASHLLSEPLSFVVQDLVREWGHHYDALFYMPPLPYQSDNVRPLERFRDKVDEELKRLLVNWNLPNVYYGISRKNVLRLILDEIQLESLPEGFEHRILNEDQLAIIPEFLKRNVLIGGSYAFDKQVLGSDVDVYYLGRRVQRDMESELSLSRVLGVAVDVTEVHSDYWQYLRSQGFKQMNFEG